MMLIALSALCLGGARLWQDILYCRQKAAFHEDMAAFHRGGWPSNMNRSDAALLFAVVRRRPELSVLHSPQGKRTGPTAKPLAVESRDDPLPTGVRLRLGTLRFRPPSIVAELALSPDEANVASAGKELIVWDAATGKKRWASRRA
jgi:hypothetical protein